MQYRRFLASGLHLCLSVKKAIDLSLTTDFGPVSDLSLRDTGRRFITCYRAAGYSRSYIKRLEETVGYLAGYSEYQVWPPVSHISPQHLEEYLAYSHTRKKWYGKRKITGDVPPLTATWTGSIASYTGSGPTW